MRFAGVVLALVLSISPALAQKVSLQVERARQSFDSRTAEPVIAIKLSADSTKVFADFSQAHVGRRLRFGFGDRVLATPILREPITAGEIQMSGLEDVEQTVAMAVEISQRGAIDVEALPAP